MTNSLALPLSFMLLACSATNQAAPETPTTKPQTYQVAETVSDPSIDQSAAITSEEKSEQIDQTLDESFAEFDRLLLRERERIGKEQNERGSGFGNGDGSSEKESDSGGIGGENETQTTSASTEEDNEQQGRGQPDNTSAKNTQANIPADVGDGSNDDVIARQLREAALKEKDPVLQKKLWDEYRKYTKSSR